MLSIKELKNRATREQKILMNSISIILILVCSYLAVAQIFKKEVSRPKNEFTQVKINHPEITGIFGIDNVALIKKISPTLQGLAEIDLKPDTSLTNDAKQSIINSASKKYILKPEHIKIIQTDTSGYIQHFVLYDLEDYLLKNPHNFEYLQWNYFGKRIENKVVIGYFGYITLKVLDNTYFETIYPPTTCHSNSLLLFAPPSGEYQAKSDTVCRS